MMLRPVCPSRTDYCSCSLSGMGLSGMDGKHTLWVSPPLVFGGEAKVASKTCSWLLAVVTLIYHEVGKRLIRSLGTAGGIMASA